jgi:hypothetical protein
MERRKKQLGRRIVSGEDHNSPTSDAHFFHAFISSFENMAEWKRLSLKEKMHVAEVMESVGEVMVRHYSSVRCKTTE